MQKPALGHIDCPTCGAAKGMRITHDKNGHPFGFCEEGCGQQLRTGPSPMRVREFIKRYPFAAKAAQPAPAPAPEPAPAPAQPAVPVTEPKPAKKGWGLMME